MILIILLKEHLQTVIHILLELLTPQQLDYSIQEQMLYQELLELTQLVYQQILVLVVFISLEQNLKIHFFL